MTLRTAATAIALLTGACASPALAQRLAAPTPAEQTGEAIYGAICQGCHMPDAKGAKGAGVYPALAANRKLAARGYPAYVIVRGQKAMPEFGSSLSDAQVANVVNYVRTNFGNSYADTVSPDDIKALRPNRAAGTIAPPG